MDGNRGKCVAGRKGKRTWNKRVVTGSRKEGIEQEGRGKCLPPKLNPGYVTAQQPCIGRLPRLKHIASIHLSLQQHSITKRYGIATKIAN